MESEKQLCILAARLLLENGAETKRVEQTVEYLARHCGATQIEVLAFPTGVSFSFVLDDPLPLTQVVRVHVRSTDLSTIARVNEISRQFVAGGLQIDGAIAALTALHEERPKTTLQEVAGSAAASGFFALLFGGGAFELCVAAIGALAGMLLSRLFHKSFLASTIQIMFSSALSALVALFACRLFPAGNVSAIIIGAIMPLLPGMLITNAVRDTVSGDLVSGVARGAEAVLKSVAIAIGVGAMLALWR